MAKKSKKAGKAGRFLATFLSVVAWLTGILVSLSVGFGMIGGTLSLPSWLGGQIVATAAGWIVVAGSLLTVLLFIIGALSRK